MVTGQGSMMMGGGMPPVISRGVGGAEEEDEILEVVEGEITIMPLLMWMISMMVDIIKNHPFKAEVLLRIYIFR